jgi:hypothetical protein
MFNSNRSSEREEGRESSMKIVLNREEKEVMRAAHEFMNI